VRICARCRSWCCNTQLSPPRWCRLLDAQGLRIDYALLSSGLRDALGSCEVLLDLPPKWSDHAPLLLELQLEQSEAAAAAAAAQGSAQGSQPAVAQVRKPLGVQQCDMWRELLKRFGPDRQQRSITALFGKAAAAAKREGGGSSASGSSRGGAASTKRLRTEGGAGGTCGDATTSSAHRHHKDGIDSSCAPIAQQAKQHVQLRASSSAEAAMQPDVMTGDGKGTPSTTPERGGAAAIATSGCDGDAGAVSGSVCGITQHTAPTTTITTAPTTTAAVRGRRGSSRRGGDIGRGSGGRTALDSKQRSLHTFFSAPAAAVKERQERPPT
jgi:hypothetical protein